MEAAGGEEDVMEQLPPGFRFRPQIFQLLFYLREKLEGRPVPCGDSIREADVYDCHPQVIIERYAPPGDKGCYVFSQTRRHRGKADRSNGLGKWKTTSGEQQICCTDEDGHEVVLGHKNNMAYYDSKDEKTHWLMDEYYIKEFRDCGNVGSKRKRAREGTKVLDRWVVCYVHLSPMKGSYHDPVDPVEWAEVGILPGEAAIPHDLQTMVPMLDDQPKLAQLAPPQPEVLLPQLDTRFPGEDYMRPSQELLVQDSLHPGDQFVAGGRPLAALRMGDNQPSGFGCLQDAQEQQPLLPILDDQPKLAPLALPQPEVLQLPQLDTRFHGEDYMWPLQELLVQHSLHPGDQFVAGAMQLAGLVMEDNQPSGFGRLQGAQEQQPMLPMLDDQPKLSPLAEVLHQPQLDAQFHGEDWMRSSQELLVQHSLHPGDQIAAGAMPLAVYLLEDNQPSAFGCLQCAQEQQSMLPSPNQSVAYVPLAQTIAPGPFPLPRPEVLPPFVNYEDPNSWLYQGNAWLTNPMEPQGAFAPPGLTVDLTAPSAGSLFLEEDGMSSLLQPSFLHALGTGETAAGVMQSDSASMEDNEYFWYLQDAIAGGQELGSLMPSVETSVGSASHPIFTSRALRSMGFWP